MKVVKITNVNIVKALFLKRKIGRGMLIVFMMAKRTTTVNLVVNYSQEHNL